MSISDSLHFHGSHFRFVDSPISEPWHRIMIRQEEQAAGMLNIKGEGSLEIPCELMKPVLVLWQRTHVHEAFCCSKVIQALPNEVGVPSTVGPSQLPVGVEQLRELLGLEVDFHLSASLKRVYLTGYRFSIRHTEPVPPIAILSRRSSATVLCDAGP